MAEIAVVVLDPQGNRYPQLVSDRRRVGELIPDMVDRLGLPGELSYRLVPSWTEQPIHPARSLAEAEVGPGAQLRLVPARDGVFTAFLRRLYQEAKDQAKEELWNRVRKRMSEILRLDPEYPDPAGLARVTNALPADLPIDPGPSIVQSPPRPRSNPAPTQGASAGGPGAGAAGGTAASSSGMAGAIAGLLVLGGIAAAVYYKPWERIDWNRLKPQPQATQTAATTTGDPKVPEPPQSKTEPYGIYVLDDPNSRYQEVFAGQLTVILDTPTGHLQGWGTDNKTTVREVTDGGQRFRMVRGPFTTAAEARKAYEAELIPGTTREPPLMNSTLAKFKFDDQDHRIDNATRFLR